MKKFLKALTAVFAVVVLAVALVGCSSGVSGKTYVATDVKVEVASDASQLEKDAATLVENQLKENIGSMPELTFKEDGTVDGMPGATWTQDGSTVSIKEGTVVTEATVKGSKLEMGGEEMGVKMVITYKVK